MRGRPMGKQLLPETHATERRRRASRCALGAEVQACISCALPSPFFFRGSRSPPRPRCATAADLFADATPPSATCKDKSRRMHRHRERDDDDDEPSSMCPLHLPSYAESEHEDTGCARPRRHLFADLPFAASGEGVAKGSSRSEDYRRNRNTTTDD